MVGDEKNIFMSSLGQARSRSSSKKSETDMIVGQNNIGDPIIALATANGESAIALKRLKSISLE